MSDVVSYLYYNWNLLQVISLLQDQRPRTPTRNPTSEIKMLEAASNSPGSSLRNESLLPAPPRFDSYSNWISLGKTLLSPFIPPSLPIRVAPPLPLLLARPPPWPAPWLGGGPLAAATHGAARAGQRDRVVEGCARGRAARLLPAARGARLHCLGDRERGRGPRCGPRLARPDCRRRARRYAAAGPPGAGRRGASAGGGGGSARRRGQQGLRGSLRGSAGRIRRGAVAAADPGRGARRARGGGGGALRPSPILTQPQAPPRGLPCHRRPPPQGG